MHRRVLAAAPVALIAGVILMLFGVLRAGGVLFRMLSASEVFIAAFIGASALQIVTSQLGSLTGITLPDYSGEMGAFFRSYGHVLENLDEIRIPEVSFSPLLSDFVSDFVLFDFPSCACETSSLSFLPCHFSQVIISVSCIILMLLIRRLSSAYKQQLRGVILPDALIVLMISTGWSYWDNWSVKYNVRVIGAVPSGLPRYTHVFFSEF